jgi:hypothetical protein
MKITKRQLRRIIREEQTRLIRERPLGPIERAREPTGWKPKAWQDHIMAAIDEALAADPKMDFKTDGWNIVEALEVLRRNIKDELRGPSR